MTLKKLNGQVHLWLGLASGLVVFILGLTGCVYCFEKELKSWLYADRIYVDTRASGRKLPVDDLLIIAQNALGKDLPINSMELVPQGDRTYKFRAIKTDEEAWNYFDEFEQYKTVYVNPYTGKVQAVENTKYEFFMLTLELHFSLWLGEWGRFVVKWSTVMFAVLLLTGIVLWWPKNKAATKQRIWFRWKKSTSFKRKNYDLHNIPGFYSMLFALAISLTGLVFGFQWFRQAVGWVGNGGTALVVDKPVVSDMLQTERTMSYQHLLDQALVQSPNAQRVFMSIPDAEKKALPIRLFASSSLQTNYHRDIYFFDQFSGKLLRQKPYAANISGDKLVAMNYDIHVGSIGGLFGEILAFIASLIATSLPVTGFIIWWGKRKKNPKGTRKNQVVAGGKSSAPARRSHRLNQTPSV